VAGKEHDYLIAAVDAVREDFDDLHHILVVEVAV